MSDRPAWDDQFTESEDERNARLRAKRLAGFSPDQIARQEARKRAADKRAIARGNPDPRDPDYSREGIFILHNCWRCQNGAARCVNGNPRQCEYPHARND